jgi:hypothetical protein
MTSFFAFLIRGELNANTARRFYFEKGAGYYFHSATFIASSISSWSASC